MRQTLFRRLMQQVPAIYTSDAPLFDFSKGVDAILPATFRADEDGAQLRFAPQDSHYIMQGGSPDTVTLIPVPAHENLYIFQQSDGMSVAFYGALRLAVDHPGFDLFSPEATPAAALDAAIGNGATATRSGYNFKQPAQLLAALIPVALEAPADTWNTYRLV